MSTKDRLQTQLQRARDLTEKTLSAFETPEQWVHQVCPAANHPLWFAGHMGTTDNFLITMLAPDRARSEPGFNERFGMGSQPTNRPGDYPPAKTVLAYMRDRRGTLLDILAGMSDADLATPVKPGGPGFFTDNASIFELAVWHEGIHAGQASVVRRAMGKPPVIG